jgi:predicted HNH restriction endonuclease
MISMKKPLLLRSLSNDSPPLSQLEESFNKIPPVIVRDLAYLPERTVNRKHVADEEKIVNLSERFRKSINHLRRFSYVNPTLLD